MSKPLAPEKHEQTLRIVHVLGSFELGGGEQVALNLAGGQVLRGHSVHVVSLAGLPEGPHAANFRAAGVEAHEIEKRGPTFDPTLVFRLAVCFRKLGASLVHTHNPLPLIYGGPAAWLVRVPVVHTKHGFNEAPSRRVLLRRIAARFPRVVVAVSAQTADDARRQQEADGSRLLVIDNGVDLSSYQPNAALRAELRRELGMPGDAQIIGTVGRLSEEKNQRLLVQAAAPLLNERVRLVLVGDGPERARLEEVIRSSEHPEFVHLLGQRLDVPRLLPAFDVFALPSRTEGLPMVLPEAMASGLPVVATSVGGIPAVIRDGETGFLVPNHGEAEMRARLGQLLLDDTLRARLGNKARELALAQYSQDRMIDAYLDVYRRVSS